MTMPENYHDDPATLQVAEQLKDAWDALWEDVQQARNCVDDPKLWAPPASPRNLAEGYRYVLGFLYGSIARSLGPTVENPYFVRAIQPLNRSTIDNADAIYLTAPIDGNYTYSIRGRVGDTSAWRAESAPEGVRKAPHYVIFETPSGFSGESGSLKELKPGTRVNCAVLDSSKLQVAADGSFEILLAPEKPADYNGNFMLTRTTRQRKQQDGSVIEKTYVAQQVMLRELFCDWANEDLMELFIYRHDRLGKPIAVYDAERATQQMHTIGTITRNQVHFWNEFYAVVCEAYGDMNGDGECFMPRNTFNKPNAASLATAGGMATNVYCGGIFELADDEALIVELHQPVEPVYIGFHLGNMWGESLEFGSHQTSLNGLQAHRDRDNVYRLVIAHHDPGIANWLDTTGQPEGYMAVRWAYPEKPMDNLPWAQALKVKFDDIRLHLPAETTQITAQEREQVIAVRQEHVQRRYRHH
ncbi:hypothetical protein ACFSB1_10350 [Halopseudomonas phragmitis]|uniref:DUF1214 domain-containing protein n=1 Tax=Halopseudomonas phragmitis TaxID=1931241 RepID=A0A1V0B979_9GAMM|nr:hypothetical protein [Halopseudomonas phragmitis]AQZ96493.1 hypothetical protein BVH74_17805 [Halopseudomonas phragmitis]